MARTKGVSLESLKKRDEMNAVNIYHWIEQNKMNYPHGINSSTLFAHVVQKVDMSGECFSLRLDLGADDPEYAAYVRYIGRLRRAGYIKFQQTTVNGKREWVVNEDKLPPGTVTYTGIRTNIPNPPAVVEPVKEEPKAPVIIEPEAQPAPERAFIEEELKNITVAHVNICRNEASFVADNISLYALYKIGLALNETTEPYVEENLPPVEVYDTSEEWEEIF